MAELDQFLIEEALLAALDFYDAARADQADAAGGGGLESDMRRRHRELMQKARGG